MPNPNTQPKGDASVISQVAERVRQSDNVLVALSKDPSVDELSAALGLTFILDRIGKHATAIFSGAVPNAIEFLEPEKTFETNTNSLQDFIIALDKEKADHLRYKIDGDYVKVFITPYKTTIDQQDMEFSHGDYNVDLVIALNVASSDDLDSALTEYGRIMHDASSINISANVPGKFGDLEWGDPTASSVSEMVFKLSEAIKEKDKDDVDKSTATALLAGIVSATNRFSNERTSPETMAVASKLMAAGADQQLISSSIPVDILTSDVVDASEDAKASSNDDLSDVIGETKAVEAEKPKDPTSLEIHHATDDREMKADDEKPANDASSKEESQPQSKPEPQPEPKQQPAPQTPQTKPEPQPEPQPEPEPQSEPVEQPEQAFGQDPKLEETPTPVVEQSPQSEQPSEPDEPPVIEAPITPIAPAVPEPQIKLSVDEPDFVMGEDPDAAAKLEQLVASNNNANGESSVLDELQDPNVHVKKNLVPPSEALEPPKVPKNYAAMMASELSDEPVQQPSAEDISESEPLSAPVPSDMPVMDTSPESTSIAQGESDTVNNEYVDPPLPMPDANTVLPPPPLPFDPAAAPESVSDAPASAPFESPSAQDFADQLKNGVEGLGGPNATVDSSIPNISMPAVAEPVQSDDSGAIQNGVMPDQVYPADPSAFRIPGM